MFKNGLLIIKGLQKLLLNDFPESMPGGISDIEYRRSLALKKYKIFINEKDLAE